MKTATLFLALFFVLAVNVSGQNRCLTTDEAKKVIESIKAPNTTENKKARKELLEMQGVREKLNSKIAADTEKNQNLIPEANQLGLKHLARVCQIIKEEGWLTREALGDDGFTAFIFLITNNKDFQAQQELLPVLIEAAKKGYIGNPLIASFVDSIRIGSKMPQIFGTQAVIKNNVVYLYPILNEDKIDEWRKMYDMPPLAYQIRAFEGRYMMPVLKSYRQPLPPSLRQSQKKNEKNSADTEILGISDENEEAITVETRLVNLNVRVLTQDLKVPAGLKLTKDDFTVSEDGTEQEISFFSNTEQPFDLVLLLDFSGSTIEKRGLIKKAAQRFVEVVRPIDRVAVVAFASDIKTISELTTDKNALSEKIKDIDLNGASPIWDSLKFVYDNILKEKTAGRRSAVVFMTDGEDNSLNTTFADAMEIARRGETTIFPVYLGKNWGSNQWATRYIRKAHQSLYMLAEESGGQFYKANDAGDLKGIYEQVAGELGQVYSIGYEPKNEVRDGGWRALTVKIKTQPNLVTRTRRGYYAN
jgi:VWFA-related protein